MITLLFFLEILEIIGRDTMLRTLVTYSVLASAGCLYFLYDLYWLFDYGHDESGRKRSHSILLTIITHVAFTIIVIFYLQYLIPNVHAYWIGSIITLIAEATIFFVLPRHYKNILQDSKSFTEIEQIATVISWDNDHGRVQFEGETWTASSKNSNSIHAGDKVTIKSRDGLRLYIEKQP